MQNELIGMYIFIALIILGVLIVLAQAAKGGDGAGYLVGGLMIVMGGFFTLVFKMMADAKERR
jgi:hypothetical protein